MSSLGLFVQPTQAGNHIIDKFLLSHHEEIKSQPTGRKVFSTWMNLRSQFVNRYLGSYIPSMSTQKIDTFPLNRMIVDEGSHHDSIMIMMCEGKMLSRKIILDWCVTRGEARGKHPPLEKILSQMSLLKSRKDSPSQLAAIDDSYRKSLLTHRAKLDEWHSALDISELPVESYVSQRQYSTTDLEILEILPLKFHTFEAAMNYAHYAHTQMLCAQDVIDQLQNPKFVVPLEDAEKSDLYQSDFKMQVAVCGKDMHTGKLYNETVGIPEMSSCYL